MTSQYLKINLWGNEELKVSINLTSEKRNRICRIYSLKGEPELHDCLRKCLEHELLHYYPSFSDLKYNFENHLDKIIEVSVSNYYATYYPIISDDNSKKNIRHLPVSTSTNDWSTQLLGQQKNKKKLYPEYTALAA